MPTYTLTINGKDHRVDAPADRPLLWVLRDQLGLIGTKFGCGIAQCGACTVHLGGTAMRSCLLPVSAVGEQSVTTIEGLANGAELHPFRKSGSSKTYPSAATARRARLASAAALLASNPAPTDDDIDAAMAGNYCRCGTYNRIRAGIKAAANRMSAAVQWYDPRERAAEDLA